MDGLENLVNTAASMWLNFCAQRCRLRIVMPGSNLRTQQERARRAKDGMLVLTLAPTVQRFGDSKGEDFSVVKPISGGDGKNVARVGKVPKATAGSEAENYREE